MKLPSSHWQEGEEVRAPSTITIPSTVSLTLPHLQTQVYRELRVAWRRNALGFQLSWKMSFLSAEFTVPSHPGRQGASQISCALINPHMLPTSLSKSLTQRDLCWMQLTPSTVYLVLVFLNIGNLFWGKFIYISYIMINNCFNTQLTNDTVLLSFGLWRADPQVSTSFGMIPTSLATKEDSVFSVSARYYLIDRPIILLKYTSSRLSP